MASRKHLPGKTVSLWTDFQQVHPVNADGSRIELEEGETYWRNSFYLVFCKQLEPARGIEGAVRLTIKHNQGKAVREWKHLQRIKNEIVGAEREAVEIFPPESMLVDLSKEHHLFVTPVGVSSIYVYEEKMRAQGLHGYDILRGDESD